MNLSIEINRISLLVFQKEGKARLLNHLIIDNVDFKGFIISHKSLKESKIKFHMI